MGYTYDELIAPAILLDNPGLNKKEFIDALANTHSGGGESGEEIPWDKKGTFNRYHYGLEGLVGILGLSESAEYLQFIKGSYDENGRHLRAPFLQKVDPEHSDYQVGLHTGYIFGRPRKLMFQSSHKYQEGSSLTRFSYGVDFINVKDERKIVNSVISKIVKEEERAEDDYIYDVRARTIRPVIETEYFHDVDSLLAKWPQLHPEYRWDFSQEKGIFDIDLGSGSFRWMMKDGRYYLDPISYDLMTAGFGNFYASFDSNGFNDRKREDDSFFGYTDLILTAEAIRQGAWKLLSYRGHQHAESFVRDFPDSGERYSRAVWDAHSSIAAKKRKMTHSELLRMQLIGGISAYD